MKVLFYSINNSANPLFERELELMSNHLDKGDEVFVLRCEGSMDSCYSNPDHKNTRCMHCKLRFSEGMKMLGIPKKNIFRLNNELNFTDLPNEFKNVEELKKFELFGIDFGMGVASLMISVFRDHDFDTRKHKELVNKMLKSSVLVYESMLATIDRLMPDLIYFFNGRYHDVRPVFRICQQREIEFCAHEAADSSMFRYSVFKNKMPHDLEFRAYDIQNIWSRGDSNRYEIGRQWFIRHRGGAKQLGLSYIDLQKKGALPHNFDQSKTNIAVFNSSMDEYEGIQEWQNPIYKDEVEALQLILEHFKNDTKIHFYLRIHPNLRNQNNRQMKNLKEIAQKKYKNLTIIWPEEIIDSYALLEACEKVLTFISTMGVEACFWGKPAILAGRAFYESLDCVYKPKNHSEVIDLLAKKLAPKSKEEAIKFGYWLSSDGIEFKKYKPTSLFTGHFLGKEVLPKYSVKKVNFWIHRFLEKLYR